MPKPAKKSPAKPAKKQQSPPAKKSSAASPPSTAKKSRMEDRGSKIAKKTSQHSAPSTQHSSPKDAAIAKGNAGLAKDSAAAAKQSLAPFEQSACRMTSGKLAAHPLADRLPRMTDAEREALKASIAQNGQIDTVLLLDGKILDGRHRDEVLKELGLLTRVEDFDPKKHGDPVEYVIAKSSHRNLTTSQKACAAALFVDDLAESRGIEGPGRPAEKSANSGTYSGKSREIAALRFGVSSGMVGYAVELRKGDESLYNEVFGGRLNINQARNRFKLKQSHAEVRKLASAPIKFSKDDCRIELGDCIELAKNQFKNWTFRIVFADPPYNNGWKYNADPTGDNLPPDKYLDWTVDWIKAAADLLAPDGSIFVLIDDNYSDHIGVVMRQLGLHRQATFVWWETFSNHIPGKFTCCTRYIHYYTKRVADFITNGGAILIPARRNEIGDARANPLGKVPDNVWQISRKQGTANDRVPFNDAPPQIPVEVVERCILYASNPGDKILDPFNGNGQTAIAALRNGRTYVGFERSPLYKKQSEKWIAAQLAEGKPSSTSKVETKSSFVAATTRCLEFCPGNDVDVPGRGQMTIVEVLNGNVRLYNGKSGKAKDVLTMPIEDLRETIGGGK